MLGKFCQQTSDKMLTENFLRKHLNDLLEPSGKTIRSFLYQLEF